MTNYSEFNMGDFAEKYYLLTADWWHIYTNIEVLPTKQGRWFYSIIVERDEEIFTVNDDLGDYPICECDECRGLDLVITEYYSIYKALTWAKENGRKSPVRLWVSSNEILFDVNEGFLWKYDEIYSCNFLRTLAKKVARLLAQFSRRINGYGSENNYIVPVASKVSEEILDH